MSADTIRRSARRNGDRPGHAACVTGVVIVVSHSSGAHPPWVARCRRRSLRWIHVAIATRIPCSGLA